ncbi:hypothetical protein J6590_006304, partial [Homalodisca vitripennis]
MAMLDVGRHVSNACFMNKNKQFMLETRWRHDVTRVRTGAGAALGSARSGDVTVHHNHSV